jgi:hypothetical protein
VKKVGTRSTASVTPEPRKRVPDNSPGLGGEGSRAPILPGVTVPKKYISASSLPSFSFVKSLLKKSVSRPLRLGVRSHPWLNSPFPFLRLDLFRVFRAFRGSSVSPSSLPSFPSVKSVSRPLRLGVRRLKLRTPEGFKLVAPGWSAGFRGALLPGVTVPHIIFPSPREARAGRGTKGEGFLPSLNPQPPHHQPS